MAEKYNIGRLNLKFLSVLTVGLILRLINLNQSFWLDEAISVLIAQKPFPSQWSGISGDFQPPLYYILLHFFMKLGSSAEWILRIPSVIFGVLTIVILYKFTKELFNRKIALTSSLILATSEFHIYYSQELRMYSLLGLLATLAMWAFYKKKWFWVTLFNILGLFTNYMAILLVVTQGMWFIFENKKDFGAMKKWTMSLLITTIFFLPWLPNLLKQWEASKILINNLPLWSELSSLPFWKLPVQIFLKFTLGRIDFYSKYFYGSVFGILAVIYGYIILHLRNKLNGKTLFILNWFTVPLIVSMLMSFFIPISGVWRLIFLLMPFTILIAVSLSFMRYFRLFLMLIVGINLAAVFLYWIYPRYRRENWRDAVLYLEQENRPIVFTAEDGFAPYHWYKKTNQLVCGPITLDKCLTNNKLTYVSYLVDLFDSKKIIEAKISQSDFELKNVNNFPGVGFIYTYDKK